MLLKLAVRYLCYQLRKDKVLWYAYQSSIAMIIMDNVHKHFPLKTAPTNEASPDPLNKEYSPTLHEFCNICANDFLNLWTNNHRRSR